ncbi:MAG: hypothetical protein J7621_27625 [Niastella sp.]|nr:hypothetical protein [Niastella sp.]
MQTLQENTRFNTIRTLQYIASKEELIRYKAEVPFVHIGHELLAQSDEIERLTDTPWFREMWTAGQLEALMCFLRSHQEIRIEFKEHMPDIPALLEHAGWLDFMIRTNDVLRRMDSAL